MQFTIIIVEAKRKAIAEAYEYVFGEDFEWPYSCLVDEAKEIMNLESK